MGDRFSYKLTGTFVADTGVFTLQPDQGQPVVPGSAITHVEGTFDARSEILRGTDPSGCRAYGTFKQPLSAAAVYIANLMTIAVVARRWSMWKYGGDRRAPDPIHAQSSIAG